MLLPESCSPLNQQTADVPALTEQTRHQPKTLTGSRYDGTAVMETMSVSEHIDMYRKFFFGKEQTSPPQELPQVKVDMDLLTAADDSRLKVSWLGHSSLLINIDGYTLLTDPVFERRLSPVGPTRFHKDLVLAVEDVPALDAVIVSHNHYDHLNKYSVKRLARQKPLFIVPLKVGKLLQKWGVPAEKIVELNWWQEAHIDKKLMIAATPAQHFSGRGLFDRNQSLWASWVISTPNRRIFFSGDSGYFSGFKTIGETYGPFDAAFIECGAYNERWSSIHMFPEQTVQAHIDLRGGVLHPIHNSTFNLSIHPWYEPMERVVKAARHRGVPLSMPIIGMVVDYEHPEPWRFWWRQAMAPLAPRKTTAEVTAGVQDIRRN